MASCKIESKIKEILGQRLMLVEAVINNNDTLRDHLHMDSLDIVQFMMSLEKEFFIDIEDAQSDRLHTVQDVIDFVHEQYVEPLS